MDEVIYENINPKNIKSAEMETSKDLIKQGHKQVEELIEISRNNFKKIIDRGDKLSHLHEVSNGLEKGAGEFKKQADVLKRKAWRKRMKTKLTIAGILLILFIIIILLIIQTFTVK